MADVSAVNSTPQVTRSTSYQRSQDVQIARETIREGNAETEITRKTTTRRQTETTKIKREIAAERQSELTREMSSTENTAQPQVKVADTSIGATLETASSAADSISANQTGTLLDVMA